jgi:hypothetical protein
LKDLKRHTFLTNDQILHPTSTIIRSHLWGFHSAMFVERTTLQCPAWVQLPGLVNIQKANWKMAIEIVILVDLPIKNDDFP